MPLRAYYRDETGTTRALPGPEQVGDAFRSGTGLLWVDFSETTADDGRLLLDLFKFHSLAVEDCVDPAVNPPKIDDYGDYIFALFHGVDHLSEADTVETVELALFIGRNYVVSNHNFPLFSVEEVRNQVETNGHPMKAGPDFLAYSLIDALVDNILPTIDRMSDVTETVEEEALGTPRQHTVEAILRLKRATRSIHRAIVPQRELLNRLSRGEFSVIDPASLVYFRDVYDHLVRIEDLNMSIRDGADNALSTYLTSVANRQNETMKVLAVAGAIFLPLTLLAGIYGMNFDYMPELRWRFGYFGVLAVMGTAIIGALAVFMKRGWFRPHARPAHVTHSLTVERKKLRGFLSPQGKHHGEH